MNQASKAILPTLLTFLFNYIAFWHSMCVLYAWVCVCMLTGMYICAQRGSKSTLSSSFNSSIHYILKQRLLLKLELSALLHLTSQLCARDFRQTTVSTQLYVKYGDLNSDPHSWKVHHLSGEPHTLHCFSLHIYKRYISLEENTCGEQWKDILFPLREKFCQMLMSFLAFIRGLWWHT